MDIKFDEAPEWTIAQLSNVWIIHKLIQPFNYHDPLVPAPCEALGHILLSSGGNPAWWKVSWWYQAAYASNTPRGMSPAGLQQGNNSVRHIVQLTSWTKDHFQAGRYSDIIENNVPKGVTLFAVTRTQKPKSYHQHAADDGLCSGLFSTLPFRSLWRRKPVPCAYTCTRPLWHARRSLQCRAWGWG